MKKFFVLAICSALSLLACKNETTSKPQDTQTAAPVLPEISSASFALEVQKVHAASDSLTNAIKSMDALIGKLPKATAAQAATHLEVLESMQRKTQQMNADFEAMTAQVKNIEENIDKYKSAKTYIDGGPQDIQKAIDEMNVSRTSILETINSEVAAIKTIASGKK